MRLLAPDPLTSTNASKIVVPLGSVPIIHIIQCYCCWCKKSTKLAGSEMFLRSHLSHGILNNAILTVKKTSLASHRRSSWAKKKVLRNAFPTNVTKKTLRNEFATSVTQHLAVTAEAAAFFFCRNSNGFKFQRV